MSYLGKYFIVIVILNFIRKDGTKIEKCYEEG